MKSNMFDNLKAVVADTITDSIKMIDINELHESADNFFIVENIEQFAQTILGQGGVKDNNKAISKINETPDGFDRTEVFSDDKVFTAALGNAMEEVKGSAKTIEKLKALCELRDITRELLNKQQTYVEDSALIPLRNKLNAAYDSFVKINVELSSKSVKKLFSLDADYPILDALEQIDPETKAVTKADIFTKRTVSPVAEITEVSSAEEAMQVSLDKKGRVDIAYMATLLQNRYENAELSDVMKYITDELLDKGMIFRDPEKIATGKPYAEIVDKSDYLCGNVRRKLVMAESFAEQDSSFNRNVEALKEVIPEEIGAAEISVDLGCTWIDTSDYEDFMRTLSGRAEYDSRNFGIRFSEITGKFSIENSKTKNISALNPNEISTYGTEDMNMYHILENLLNQKKIQVFDYFPDPMNPKKVKSVLNKNKTQVAQSKAKAIKQKFAEWIFASEENKLAVPNSMATAADAFQTPGSDGKNLYSDNSVVVKVGEEGNLTIGLRKDVTLTDDWTIWTNWQLIYYGKNSTLEESGNPLSIETVNALGVTNAEVFTLDGSRVNKLQRGVNIVRQTLSDGSTRVVKVIVK